MPALPLYPGLENYLEAERAAEVRHEFFGGDAHAMAGAPERHNQITAATHFALYGQLLEQPCQVFQSDMKVLAAQDAVFYPDVVVVCGEAQYYDATRDLLLNPVVIVEVLSPSTEDFDRGRKFKAYRNIATLRDYILVAQKQMHVEHYTYQAADSWLLREFTQPEDTLALLSVDCVLKLSDIYRKVDFSS